MSECAVWYLRYGAAMYEVCDDERGAVAFAYGLEDSENGVVSGVQFSDGRLVARDEWQALADYEQAQYEAWRNRANAEPSQPPATRQARDPFDGQSVDVDASDPAWLGAS